MVWGSGGFGNSVDAGSNGGNWGSSSHGSGSWGSSGFSSGEPCGGNIGTGGFGSSSWGHCDRPDNADPLGTHSNMCVACNTTNWSNQGLMKPHYDESCPGCRRERSMAQMGSEQFGGYGSLEYAAGSMVLGSMYAYAQSEGGEEAEKKKSKFLGFLKKGKENIVPRIPKKGPPKLATTSLWGDKLLEKRNHPPNSKLSKMEKLKKTSSSIEEEAMETSMTSSTETGDFETISSDGQEGTISSPEVKGFKSLWDTQSKSKFGGPSLWGLGGNRKIRMANKSIFT
ncbi:uncharacterized transmembrane protein DDB_G0289901-like [Mya arenaria]|uniref:uncharacterized transmembrane protein DDB_G0289901-like n=1 Tax=Mya arenaria TaxID=6604 RepID=UPI0022E3E46C|nr:uncharacterized transmembrane protein DDB_G0289901-like [Mya arenaria]